MNIFLIFLIFRFLWTLCFRCVFTFEIRPFLPHNGKCCTWMWLRAYAERFHWTIPLNDLLSDSLSDLLSNSLNYPLSDSLNDSPAYLPKYNFSLEHVCCLISFLFVDFHPFLVLKLDSRLDSWLDSWLNCRLDSKLYSTACSALRRPVHRVA